MHPGEVEVLYRVPKGRAGWELSDGTVPESVVHDEAVTLLREILTWWALRRGMQVARNLAVRWDQAHPKVGVDPDLCVLSPPPPRDGDDLESVRTWAPGHSAPLLAVEVVSAIHPNKDYVIVPDKYAASGTRELWIFDPLIEGPRSHGGPFLLQVWHRDGEGRLVRTYAGEGPATSLALGAHLVVHDRRLRVADDADGRHLWPTDAEAAKKALER